MAVFVHLWSFFSPHSGWFAALSVVYLTSLSRFCLYFYLFCIFSRFYWVTFTFPGLSFEQKPNKNIKCETKAGLMLCFRCQWTKNQTSQRTVNRHTSFSLRVSGAAEKWAACVCVCVHKSSVLPRSEMLCKKDNRGIVHLPATDRRQRGLWHR